MRPCISHHHACDCRELRFKKMERALRVYADPKNWRELDLTETRTDKNGDTDLQTYTSKVRAFIMKKEPWALARRILLDEEVLG